MAVNLTEQFSALLSNKIRPPSSIENMRIAYARAAPYPYIVMDNLFPDELLRAMAEEIKAMQGNDWRIVQREGLERVARMRSGAEIGPAGVEMLSIVHSAGFLYFLSEITGIWQLLPDPYLQGAGYAAMRPGDFFNVHADRSVAYDTGLTRRLVMNVYLNDSWNSSYNGQLELWNSHATRCEVSIDPVFNRTAIFEVAFPNYHGVPAPLACPPEEMRKSFIAYYHTVGNGNKAEVKPHSSLFAPNLYKERKITPKKVLRNLAPPILLKLARRFFRF